MKSWLAAPLTALVATGLVACGGDSNTRRPAPELPDVEPTPSTLTLSLLGRHAAGVFDGSAAEIVAHDPLGQRIFVVNAQKGQLDVLDARRPDEPVLKTSLSVNDIAEGATVNSVALRGDLLAVAVEPAVKTDPGHVAVYRLSADDISRVAVVQVGALPDMLIFTPDGRTLLVANEGEPSDDYRIDPEGSISLIDVSNPDVETLPVRTAHFRDFNAQEDTLRAQGVRLFGPGATVAQDLEPEYIAVSEDGLRAWAVLQENNALAHIDVTAGRVTRITALGYKDHGLPGQGLDPSDKDGVHVRPMAGVFGMYQPDGLVAYEVEGRTWLVSANEGDARAWGEDNPLYWGSSKDCSAANEELGFVEEIRVKHLVHAKGFARRCQDGKDPGDMPPQLIAMAAGALLNPEVFAYCGATAGDPGDCREDQVLGRLKVTWTQGYRTDEQGAPLRFNAAGEEDPQGDRLMYDALYAYGGRSFSIWDDQGQLVWDAGDEFERFLASDECMAGPSRDIPCAGVFNSGHDEGGEDALDSRSDAKGPEPEGVAIGRLGDKVFAFIGLERMGGVFVYDVTDPRAPKRVDYFNSRETWDSTPGQDNLAMQGDLGPEGLTFVPASESPTDTPLLIVGNEVSGTTAVLEIRQLFD